MIILVKNKKRKTLRNIVALTSVSLTVLCPAYASASVFSSFSDKVKSIISKEENEETEDDLNKSSQTMNVLKPVVVDTEEISAAIVEDNKETDSLAATTGSLRVSTEEIDFPATDEISVYEVKKGDSLATVAKLFGVSKNTIIWANDLKNNTLTVGESIVILPMTGIRHTVKNGDTIKIIAKKYKADISDIAQFNGLSTDSELEVGDIVLVPDGEVTVAQNNTKKKNPKSKILNSYYTSAPSGALIRPIIGGRRTQGIHGHNGVDIAATPGTPIMASGDGKVILARSGGYNGGYGNMVIIMHAGKIQTVYAHMRNVYVSSGQEVKQGVVIGTVGNTGRSTGPHIHFEVRGAKNPF